MNIVSWDAQIYSWDQNVYAFKSLVDTAYNQIRAFYRGFLSP